MTLTELEAYLAEVRAAREAGMDGPPEPIDVLRPDGYCGWCEEPGCRSLSHAMLDGEVTAADLMANAVLT